MFHSSDKPYFAMMYYSSFNTKQILVAKIWPKIVTSMFISEISLKCSSCLGLLLSSFGIRIILLSYKMSWIFFSFLERKYSIIIKNMALQPDALVGILICHYLDVQHYQLLSPIFEPYINGAIQYVLFWVQFLSISIMFVRFICVVT